jgi:hypothetical protein
MPVTLKKKIIKVDISKSPLVLQERPETLTGSSYKIKPSTTDHAIYITINDITEHGVTRPYEIFVNSKCQQSYSWLLTVTRLISAILRKNDDPTFMIEELKGVFDPKGGYFYPKKGFIPSISAHIGMILEQHIGKLHVH